MFRCEVFVDLFSFEEAIDMNDLFEGCGGVGVMRQLSSTMEPMMSPSRSTTSGAGTSQLACCRRATAWRPMVHVLAQL